MLNLHHDLNGSCFAFRYVADLHPDPSCIFASMLLVLYIENLCGLTHLFMETANSNNKSLKIAIFCEISLIAGFDALSSPASSSHHDNHAQDEQTSSNGNQQRIVFEEVVLLLWLPSALVDVELLHDILAAIAGAILCRRQGRVVILAVMIAINVPLRAARGHNVLGAVTIDAGDVDIVGPIEREERQRVAAIAIACQRRSRCCLSRRESKR